MARLLPLLLAALAAGSSAEVQQVTTQKEFQQILKDNPAVAVDFFSTTCGPCIMIAPKFKEVRARPRRRAAPKCVPPAIAS